MKKLVTLVLALYSSTAVAVDSDGDGLSDADELVVGLPPTVADSDQDGTLDVVDDDIDNDQIPNIDECNVGITTEISLVNGGFESPACRGNGLCFPSESQMVGWKTTAPDRIFEQWPSGIWGNPGFAGQSFVELNANFVSTLYQDIATTPGNSFLYSFAHRGREGTDTMAFQLGVPGSKLNEIRRVSTNNGPWRVYSGAITIPAGQTSTRFAFASISSACGSSCGNFLDGVSFRPACLADFDQDGIYDALDTDTDNDGLADIVEGKAFFRNPDRDGDEWLDGQDNCIAVSNPTQKDSDRDGSGDACDDDLDGDTIPNLLDNCLEVSNFDQANLDRDFEGDACDADADGDSRVNEQDNCPVKWNPDQADLDLDGVGDACDADADGDIVPDEIDNCLCLGNFDQANNDYDSQGDACDLDDDNDGIGDETDNCQLIFNEDQKDTDGDGKGDLCDSDLDGDSHENEQDNCVMIANPDQSDIDDDLTGDVCDADADGDEIPNVEDNCSAVSNSDQSDLDGDKTGDVCDEDLDGDEISNITDNCLTVANTSQLDQDLDGIGDICDSDLDGDLVLNEQDNCPTVVNADQANLDQDVFGDACDSDRDGDLIENAEDSCVEIQNADQADVDADGLGDSCDPDADGDGMPNVEETKIGTDPLKLDSDGDGYDDHAEVLRGADPTNGKDVPAGRYSGGCSQIPVSSFAILALLLPAIYRRRRFLLGLIFGLVGVAQAEIIPETQVPDFVQVASYKPDLGLVYSKGFNGQLSLQWVRDPIRWTPEIGATRILVRDLGVSNLMVGYNWNGWVGRLNASGIVSVNGTLPDTQGFQASSLYLGRFWSGKAGFLHPSVGLMVPGSLQAPYSVAQPTPLIELSAGSSVRRLLL